MKFPCSSKSILIHFYLRISSLYVSLIMTMFLRICSLKEPSIKLSQGYSDVCLSLLLTLAVYVLKIGIFNSALLSVLIISI